MMRKMYAFIGKRRRTEFKRQISFHFIHLTQKKHNGGGLTFGFQSAWHAKIYNFRRIPIACSLRMLIYYLGWTKFAVLIRSTLCSMRRTNFSHHCAWLIDWLDWLGWSYHGFLVLVGIGVVVFVFVVDVAIDVIVFGLGQLIFVLTEMNARKEGMKRGNADTT